MILFISQFREFQRNGAVALRGDLKNFTEDLIFTHEDTGKNLLIYNDSQTETEIIDYQGNCETRDDLTGACIVPNTYKLKQSLVYRVDLEDLSSKRAIYDETLDY